jgi:hypothetical protein
MGALTTPGNGSMPSNSLLQFGRRLGGGWLFQGPVQRLRRRRRALCRAWQAWLYAFQFAIAARAASRRLVSTGVFSDGCSDRASIMAASPDRSWQLPRQAIISSVDIGSNQFRDLKRGTRLSVGRCLAASYVAYAGCRFAFAGQIVAFARHSWARGRVIDHAPRFLV